MNDLQELIEEFITGRKRYIDRDDGTTEQVQEMALLDVLEEAKTLRTGKSGCSGGSSMPVSGDPLVIEADIIKTIHEQIGVHNRHAAASLTLKQRIPFWANLVQVTQAKDWLVYWSGQIKALGYTTQELMVLCPNCGCAGDYELIDGEQTFKRAIRVTKETLTAECWICQAYWHGEKQLRELSEISIELA